MANIAKPNFNLIWAQSGAVVAPDSSKVASGWIQEMMTFQNENWIQNRQDQGIAYLLQAGVAEWDSSSEYYANKSIVQRNGVLYKANIDTSGTDPLTDTTNWSPLSPSVDGFGAIGTWSINITGNAGTVTNGVYTNNAQTITGSKTFSAATVFSNTTASTSTTTGAVRISGGLGVTGSIYAGGLFGNLTGNVTGNLSGNATSANQLSTPRNISISGGVTGTATSFNGSQNISIPVTSIDLSFASGTLAVNRGGTGTTTSTGTGSVVLNNSPVFSGTPSAPTAEASNSTAQLATTAFVQAVNSSDTGSSSTALTLKNPRTISLSGAITTTPTAFDGSANISIPVTSIDVANDAVSGVLSVEHGGTGATTSTGSGSAVLSVSPALTGTPTGPTAASTTNTTQLATTAFVQAVNSSDTGSAATAVSLKTARTIGITGAVTGTPTSFNGTANISIPITALDVSAATAGTLAVARGGTGVTTATGSGSVVLSTSPALAGAPTAPTAAIGTNNTQIATTAYTVSQISNMAPAKNGTGATGTWPINVSGTSDSTISATATGFLNTASIADANTANTLGGFSVRFLSGSNKPSGVTDGVLTTSAYSSLWAYQTFGDWRTGKLWTRPLNNGTWQAWEALATESLVALKANIASPAFTGVPTAPTASAGTNTAQIATTAFVAALGALKADIDSPALTGTPTAPTALAGTNTNQIATTAFVQAVNSSDTGSAATAVSLKTARTIGISGAVTGTATSFNGTANITIPITALDVSAATAGTLSVVRGGTGTTTSTGSGSVVLSASPALSGVPTSPTADYASASTQIATTAFAKGLFSTLSVSPAGADWDAETTPGTGRYLMQPGALNAPVSGFFYGVTLSYGTLSGSSNVTQLAIGYNVKRMFIRYRFSGAWTPWTEFITSDNIATQVTNRSLTADTLTTSRTISLTGAITGTATSFDGSANISIPVTSVDVSSAAVSGILGVDHGGTGFATYAVGDILFAGTTTGLSRLAGVATGNALLSGGVNTAPAWGKIGLTTHVSGILPIANGGTGNSTGLAASATVLATARTIQTNLGSTAAASFNGSANVSPGVTGTLPITNGGTGATTVAGALTNLGLSGFITSVTTYAALRAYSGPLNTIILADATIGGTFVYDSSDTTSTDNGGTTIVGSDNRRWKRVFSGAINARWFGNNGAAIQSALNVAGVTFNEVFIPAGDYACSAEIVIPPFVNIKGDGFKTRLVASFAPPRGLLVISGGTGATGNITGRWIRDISLIGNGNGAGLGTDIASTDSTLKYVYGFNLHNIHMETFEYGMQMQALWHSQINQCTTSACRIGLHLYGQCVSVNVNASHFRRDSRTATNTFGIRIQPRAYAWNSNNNARSEAIVIDGETMCIGQQYGIYLDDGLDIQMSNLDLDYIQSVGITIVNVNGGCNIKDSWIAADASVTTQFSGINMQAATSVQQIVQLRGLHINCANANASNNNIGVQIVGTGAAYQRLVNIGDTTCSGGWASLYVAGSSGAVNVTGCAFGAIVYISNSSNLSIKETYLNGVTEVSKPAGTFNRYSNNTGLPSTGGVIRVNVPGGATTGSANIPGASSGLPTYMLVKWDQDVAAASDKVSLSGLGVINVSRPVAVGTAVGTIVEYQAY